MPIVQVQTEQRHMVCVHAENSQGVPGQFEGEFCRVMLIPLVWVVIKRFPSIHGLDEGQKKEENHLGQAVSDLGVPRPVVKRYCTGQGILVAQVSYTVHNASVLYDQRSQRHTLLLLP